jgi:type I restriction enzyme S subunit
MIQYLTLPEIALKEKHSIKRGPFGGALKKEIFVEEGYAVYEQQHAIYKGFDSARYFVDERKYQELASFKVGQGDLLISCSGTIGKIAEVPSGFMPGIINQALLKLSLNQKVVHNKYFIYLFESELIQNQLFNLSHGSGLKNFPPMSVIKSIKFPLPPLATQRKIAEILDAADAHRQKTKQLLAKYDELAQSIFLDMFGDAFTNKKGFPMVKLGEQCEELFLGLTSKVDYVDEGGYPLIRATNINKGVLDMSEVKYISDNQHKTLTKKRITKRGDVLISKSGSLGTCAIVDNDIEFSTYESIFTVRPLEGKMSNKFLVYLVRNKGFQLKLLGRQVGGTVAHLNLKMFRDFEFPLPPIKLQNEFAERIDMLENQRVLTIQEAQKSENLFNSLLQKAFKGGLNV